MISRLADKITRLNHITLNAPPGSRKKLHQFYVGILGLEEIKPPKELTDVYDIMWFKFLDIGLYFEFSSHFVRTLDVSRHIALEVRNLREFKDIIKSKGIEIEGAVEKPDQDRFYMRDPVGNLFELLELRTKQ